MGEPSKKQRNSEPKSAVKLSAATDSIGGAWPAVGKIIGFFLLFLSLVMGFNALVNSGLRQIKTSGFGVTNKILTGQVNADILINGSSRALTHYDPRIIQRKIGQTVYNIGLNGSQTDMQLARLKAYLRHNAKPKLLIQNLDLFSFQVTHGGVYDPGQYLPYLGEIPIYEALTRINSETWKSKYLPLYGYAVEDLRFTWILGLRGRFGYNPPEDHFLGFKPRNLAWTGEFEHFQAQHRTGVHVEIEPAGVRVLEEILQLCKAQEIPVILVYSPEYFPMQALTSNRQQVFLRFEEIAALYGAALWDYSDSSISALQENFYNSQHLNAKGATEFTTEIAERLATNLFVKIISPSINPAN